MRLSAFTVGLLAVFTPLAAAWSKEDREIFRVRDELAAALGPDVTFYDFVGVPPSASLEEINRAYRKKTRALHPDKVKQQLRAERAMNKGQKGKSDSKSGKKSGKKPGVHVAKPPSAAELKQAVKKASDMQARLSIVTNILRGPERDRYDHFLANGFPVWKGTGYYYNRYRPGFGTVMFGLFIFVGGGAHYLALYTSWKRQREFVERYIRFARQSAWGENLGIDGAGVGNAGSVLPPIQTAVDPTDDDNDAPQQQQAMAMNRKQRRMQERDAKREAAKEAAATAGTSRRTAAGRRAAAAAGNRSGTATPTPASTSTAAAAPSTGPTGTKKRVVAQNGKILVVDSLGDVYLEQMDAEGNVEEYLLDINEVPCPTFRDTAVYRLPAWAYSLVVSRMLGKKTGSDEIEYEEVEEEEYVVEEEDDDDDSSPGRATPNTDEDFELVSKSTESLRGGAGESNTPAKVSSQSKPKANKRKGKKR